MSRKPWIVTAVLSVFVLAGCGQRQQIEELAEQLDNTRKEVAGLAEANVTLKQQLAALSASQARAATNAATADARMTDKFMHVLASNINTMVAAQIDERVGTTEELDAIMAETIQDELAAVEERKEEERQQRREQWRQDAEKRRKEWQQNQATKLAEELNLDETQQEQVQTANEAMRDDMRKAMQNLRTNGNWSAIGTTMAEIRETNNSRMKEIMSDEQYSSYTNRQAQQIRSVTDFIGGAIQSMSGGRRQ